MADRHKFCIGRLRVGPISEAYYSPQELVSFGSKALAWPWVKKHDVGLEVQFCSSTDESGNALPGPSPEQIHATCEALSKQGHKLSLHLSAWLIDLFRPDRHTETPVLNPNEFFERFGFTHIVGHFKAHEDIWGLSLHDESYSLHGMQLEDKFASKILLENGYKRINRLSELAAELTRRNSHTAARRAYACFDIGHWLRSMYEWYWLHEKGVPVFNDSAWRYAINSREMSRIKSDVSGLGSALRQADDELRHELEDELRVKSDILQHFTARKRVGNEAYYLNDGRLADCGKYVKRLHVHSLNRIGTYRMRHKSLPKVLDHFPFGYSGYYPTPLQSAILNHIISNTPQLEGITVEHLKEFNTEPWLYGAFKKANAQLLD